MRNADLFGNPVLPAEGLATVRFLGVEPVTSPTRGLMVRVVAEVAAGPDAGARCYKPLTRDLRGIAWIEKAVAASGLTVSLAPTGSYVDRAAAALVLRRAEVRTRLYHYAHASGAVYPTLGPVFGPA